MLTGNESKVNELDDAIKNIEKQRDALKTGMAKAMGIGNENKDKDILRSSNNQAVTGKPEFAVQQNKAINTQFNFPAETSGKQDDGKDNKDNGGTGNPDNTGSSDSVIGKIIEALNSCDVKDNGPETLYVPGTFNDYVNKDDYKNPIDYYKAVDDHVGVYIDKGDSEGLKRFLKENKLDKDTSFKFWLGLNNKDGGDKGEEDTITSGDISQDEYNKQLADLSGQIDKAKKDAEDSYAKITTLPYTDPEINEYQKTYLDSLDTISKLGKDINALKQMRAGSVKNDPKFNTTGIINNQEDLGNMPLGSKGNMANNGCGAVASQNALVLLGDKSNFTDVYNYFNDDSKMNLGSLTGGTLGTSPDAVEGYIESKGHEVTIQDFNTDELKKPGVSVLVYIWIGPDGTPGAHYMAAQSDGTNVNVYNYSSLANSYKTYTFDTGKNPQDTSITKLPDDMDMITKSKQPFWNFVLENPVQNIFSGNPFDTFKLDKSLVNYFTSNETALSYIMKID